MDKTNYSLEYMDVDEPILDTTFKVDNQCQWDVSMQEVDLGNEHEATTPQPSFTQIENTHHNLPDITHIKNPFIIPEIANTTQSPNPEDQNFNLPQSPIINNENFEVNPVPIVNVATSNGNIIQEIANACEDIEMSCSNQMIDSLNVPEDISNLKMFRDSMEADPLQTDSLIVSAESILNEAFNISTDSLEIPCTVAKKHKTDTTSIEILPENVKRAETILAVDKQPTTDLSFEMIVTKSKLISTAQTDSNQISNITVETNSNNMSKFLNSTTAECSKTDLRNISNTMNSTTLDVESVETDTDMPNVLHSTTIVVDPTEIDSRNISDAIAVETVETDVLNFATMLVESTESDSKIISNAINSAAETDSNKMTNILNTTPLLVVSAEGDSEKITSDNVTTLPMESVATDSNQMSKSLNSTSAKIDSSINSIFVSLSTLEILQAVETPEIVAETVSNTQNISVSVSSEETSSNLGILKSHPDTTNPTEVVLNVSGDAISNTLELKDFHPAISNISITDKSSTESNAPVTKVIHSLETCNISETPEFEKLAHSLESCKISTPESEKAYSSEPLKITTETDKINLLESTKILPEPEKINLLESCKVQITPESEKMYSLEYFKIPTETDKINLLESNQISPESEKISLVESYKVAVTPESEKMYSLASFKIPAETDKINLLKSTNISPESEKNNLLESCKVQITPESEKIYSLEYFKINTETDKINLLKSNQIPPKSEKINSLKSIQILPESDKIDLLQSNQISPESVKNNLSESCKILHETQNLESSREIPSNSEKLEILLESCKILDSELNAELAIVPSGVTIATPKKLMKSISVDIKNSPLHENYNSSDSNAVGDSKTILQTSEGTNKSPTKVSEIVSNKPAVLSKESVFANISRAANILIESPKKLVDIINKKSPKKNIVPDSSSLKNIDNQENKLIPPKNLDKTTDKFNISVNSPVKLFDILNQDCSSQIKNAESPNISDSITSSSGIIETIHSDTHKHLPVDSVDLTSVVHLDHSSEVSIDKRKVVEMSSQKSLSKNLEKISEVSSNENTSKLESSSPKNSQENQKISINTLNFAGPVDDSKTIIASNAHVLSKTGELQNPVQPALKTPVGKTIPLDLDQLSGCISLDSSKPIVKPEPLKKSSISEYAVAPDFDVKEQEVAMNRGSFSESDLVESEKKFSLHDTSGELKDFNTTHTGKSEGVMNATPILNLECVLNTNDTLVSENVNNASAMERALNSTVTIISENLNTTNTLEDDVFNTTITEISPNLNSTNIVADNVLNTNILRPVNLETTNTVDENVLNATSTVILETLKTTNIEILSDLNNTNTVKENVLNTTDTLIPENLNNINSLEENVLNTTNTLIPENLNTTGTNEGVLNTTNTVIPENLNTTDTNEDILNATNTVKTEQLHITNTVECLLNTSKTVDGVITTPNNIVDLLNTTNTIIAENVINATNIESAGNDLNIINADDCLNTTTTIDTVFPKTLIDLNVNNPIIANQVCLNTTDIPNPASSVAIIALSHCSTTTTNIPNSTNMLTAKPLGINNTEDAFNTNNTDVSGSSFSEFNVSSENTFNTTVILCDEKLNSTQISTAQPDKPKRPSTNSYITGLVGEMVESSVDNSEIKSLPQEVGCDTKILSELQFDKSFDEKAGLNKSQIRKKRNSPLKLFPGSVLPNDEAAVNFNAVTSPKRVDLPQIHKIISPVLTLKSSESLKKLQSPKLKDSDEKGNTSCSPKITLKSVCRKSDKSASSNTEKYTCMDEPPLDDTVELGNNTLLMSSTKVSEDSFNAVCANNNPEDQDGLVCDSSKSQKTVLVKDSVEDRSPFKKINSNWKDSKVKKVEETIMPDVVIKAEEVNEAKILYENKENFNLSIFSNSPAKPKSTNRRDTLFRLFDPLYDSLSPDTTVSSNSPQSTDRNETISNKAKMEDAIDERMKMEQELNELKLELNQLQQERTSLQLELHQKEEVILKIQGEAQKLGNQYKQEIKQLQDKLNTINEQNNNEEVKILREEISKLKDRDVQLNEKSSKLVDQIAALENTVHNYETTLDRVIKESEKLRVEHDNTKKHLATLEVSFSDVHAKYERTKEFVVAYKNNEEVLSDKLEKSEEIARRYEERYETLKAHAKAQIDKANKELSTMKEKHQIELNKMTALLRRLEIKTGSIQQALDQKTMECAALAALCDEISGSVPQ